MECPSCRTPLVMTDRQGVEIDHCPNCRGVWLDRGELDKLIERSNAYFGGPSGPAADGGHYPRGGDDHRARPPYPQEYRQKKSFWQEMFD